MARLAVTVTSPWKPPCHEPVILYVAAHASPLAGVVVGATEGVGEAVVADGVGEGVVTVPMASSSSVKVPWVGLMSVSPPLPSQPRSGLNSRYVPEPQA